MAHALHDRVRHNCVIPRPAEGQNSPGIRSRAKSAAGSTCVLPAPPKEFARPQDDGLCVVSVLSQSFCRAASGLNPPPLDEVPPEDGAADEVLAAPSGRTF